MGTNFYWIDDANEDAAEGDIHCHIGKRSAAGAYCWDCGTTLCKEGTRGVHSSRCGYYDACPACGAEKRPVTLADSTSGVELGCANSPDVARIGVGSCASFIWTLMKHKWALEKRMEQGDEALCVEDEYGRRFTARQFLREELAAVAFEMQDARNFC